MRKRTLTLGLLLGVLCASPVLAHPHVFINNKMTLLFDAGTLKGMSFRWEFDEMFTAMILADFKPQADGTFPPKVASGIKTFAFDNLENYHYFLVFYEGKKQLAKIKIEQFTPSVTSDKKMVYSFFVPLDLPVTAAEQTVRVTVYDDSYFVAFDIMHVEDVTVTRGQDVSLGLSVEKEKVKPLWPGQYMPDQLVIRFKENS